MRDLLTYNQWFKALLTPSLVNEVLISVREYNALVERVYSIQSCENLNDLEIILALSKNARTMSLITIREKNMIDAIYLHSIW